MQIKHTFVFTLMLGLLWVGLLFAYQNGPDPGVNGIFGQAACNVLGCHVGNPLNSAGGSLVVNGLPAEYTPGQTYALSVVVQRTGAVKYGFQISAVNASNAQAGSFTPTSNRVSVITGGGVQFAQHNQLATTIAPFTGIFTMNWQAPASEAAGTVRFNIAGNAANGDVQNTGDFIYTQVIDIPAAVGRPRPLLHLHPRRHPHPRRPFDIPVLRDRQCRRRIVANGRNRRSDGCRVFAYSGGCRQHHSDRSIYLWISH